jgi:glycosyltransferase involved in cell wall biosynthesis
VKLAQGRTIGRISELIRENQIDLIHLNVQIARDLFGVAAAADSGIPCVSHLRSIRGDLKGPALDLVNRRVNTFVAISGVNREYWQKIGIPGERVQVINNGIGDIGISPADIREDWNITDEVKTIIGSISPLHEEKGHDFLIQAFARYEKRNPHSLLMIVGDGPHRQNLIALAEREGVGKKVIFTGRQERAREMCASFDVSVVPSRYDSFGRVVLESMQAGTPLVATDAGAIREIVRDGENGMLVRYGDVGSFVKAVESITESSEVRRKLVTEGRKTIEGPFSIRRCCREIETIYDRILSNTGKGEGAGGGSR